MLAEKRKLVVSLEGLHCVSCAGSSGRVGRTGLLSSARGHPGGEEAIYVLPVRRSQTVLVCANKAPKAAPRVLVMTSVMSECRCGM